MSEKEFFNVTVVTTGGVCEKLIPYVARVTRGFDMRTISAPFVGKLQQEKDLELLHKLLRFKHLSVFEFSNIVFQIECPIYVARQLMRYRCSSFIERSLRVCGPMESDEAYFAYNDAIKAGQKREDARALLPLSTQTRFLWSLNLRELLHIAEERLTPNAQAMTRDIVQKMVDLTSEHFPHVIEYWQSDRVIGYWKEYRKDSKCPTK